MSEEDLSIFKAQCQKVFGYPPEYITYMIAEVDTRLKTMEKNWDEAMPAIGAAIVKTEATVELMSEKDHRLTTKIEKAINKIIGSNSLKLIKG